MLVRGMCASPFKAKNASACCPANVLSDHISVNSPASHILYPSSLISLRHGHIRMHTCAPTQTQKKTCTGEHVHMFLYQTYDYPFRTCCYCACCFLNSVLLVFLITPLFSLPLTFPLALPPHGAQHGPSNSGGCGMFRRIWALMLALLLARQVRLSLQRGIANSSTRTRQTGLPHWQLQGSRRQLYGL